jgi:hypothetical protein
VIGSAGLLEIGEVHDPETHLTPLVLEAARGGAPIQILGTAAAFVITSAYWTSQMLTCAHSIIC